MTYVWVPKSFIACNRSAITVWNTPRTVPRTSMVPFMRVLLNRFNRSSADLRLKTSMTFSKPFITVVKELNILFMSVLIVSAKLVLPVAGAIDGISMSQRQFYGARSNELPPGKL